jgi:hypothetical protein
LVLQQQQEGQKRKKIIIKYQHEEGYKKKRISFERGTTLRELEREEDFCEIPTTRGPYEEEDRS